MVPFDNVYEMIGNTPMIDVSKLSPNPNAVSYTHLTLPTILRV